MEEWGVVYRATQLSLERQVALKLISPELSCEQRFRERFLREAKLAASLDHPHLLPVYETGEAKGTLFLAMRLVEGQSLAELLRRQGSLPPEHALRLFSQLCSALRAAHGTGLLHRDVKPGNVLLAGAGEHEHAYLCDFGLARRLAGGSLTAERAFLGTATYAAPEQIRGEEVDARADLYALACLLYECLAGQPPFRAEDELALCWAHLHDPAPSPSTLDPALAGFDPFFQRALAKHSVERFPSASELAQAAQAAFAGALPAALPATGPLVKLPRPPTAFLGRERELQEVLERLLDEDIRLLTLTGPGGTGKTRLALRAAEEAAAAYPDGVHWVGLASLRDPTLVVETIAQTLETKQELAQHIAERRLLLLLDNLEQVIEAAPELSGLLQACPNLSLLVTSRELLRVQGELEYEVPPLAEPEAVALFCERSGLAPSDEISELCARLDNLPLAVELAAARTKALSPKQILERLSSRLDLFKGGRDTDPRQQTLRATIAWSYDLLSEDEQTLFRRLSVFAGGCTLEAAEEIASADLDTLQSLVEKSLVRFSNERFWMLETIREYAVGKLEQSKDAVATRARHSDYFVKLADEAYPETEGPDQVVCMERLEHEHDNFRATLARVREIGDGELELRLALALAPFRSKRGYLTEGRLSLTRALAAGGDPMLRARALHYAGFLALSQGRHDEAEALLEEGLRLARQFDDVELTARLLLTLAGAVSERDETEAEGLYAELLAFVEEHGEDRFPRPFVALGDFALRRGNYASAEQYSARSLQLLGEEGDAWARAVALGNLGMALLGLGRELEAREQLAESLRLYESIGDKQGVAAGLSILASVLAGRGEPERGARLLARADLLLGEIEAELSPGVEGVLYDRALARVREELDDFESVWSEGRAMTLREAVAEALEEAATGTS